MMILFSFSLSKLKLPKMFSNRNLISRIIFISFLFIGLCHCYTLEESTTNESEKPLSENGSMGMHEKKHHDIHVAAWRYWYVGKPLLIAGFIVAVCMIKILLHHARRLEELIPESCLLILLGIGFGFLFLVEGAQPELHFLHFSEKSFFLFLLPPIILEAAYSLKDRAFVENLGTIVLYAVLGTILNVFIVGPALFGLYWSGIMGNMTLTFLECLIFSTIIAAVDPVAVLAIFEEIGVNKMLYFMVFGESLFNDAVTVVIYNMVISFMQIESVGARELGLGFAAFICVSLGGLAIGLIYGFLSAFLTKYSTKMRMLEPAIFYSVAYLSYLSAELFHFSGIISIICCGLIQSYYAAENISSKSYITVYHFSKVMSGIAESLIFIILGVMLVTEYKAWTNFNVGFALCAVALCIAARFAVVFFLAYIVNSIVVSVRKIRLQEQFIMAYGGLRGAVTFSLVFMLDPNILDQKSDTKDVLLTSAYVIIFFTTFLQGITIKPLVKSMRIRLETKGTTCLKEIDMAVMDDAMAGMEEIIGHRGSYYWAAVTQYLSDRFIKPAVQKFPNRNRSYSCFLAAYQEAHIKEKFTMSPTCVDLPTQAALWTELETNDKGHIPHTVTDLELECQDEIGYGIRKGQKLEAREKRKNKQKPQLPPLKLDNPQDMLALRDILQTPPHKTVHYTFDKTGTQEEEKHKSLLNQVRHVGHFRRRHHHASKAGAGRKNHRVNNMVLETALIPLGITLIKKRSNGGSGQHLGVKNMKNDGVGMRRTSTADAGFVTAREYLTDSSREEKEEKVMFHLGDMVSEKEPKETDGLLHVPRNY